MRGTVGPMTEASPSSSSAKAGQKVERLMYVLPVIGRIVSKDQQAYRYLYESVMMFPEGPEFLYRLELSGFKNTRVHRMSLGIANLYLAEKT